MLTIWKAIAHPDNFDGTENDVEVGYYETEYLARMGFEDWVKHSRRPHPQPCCVWVLQLREITLNETARPW